MKYPGWTKNQLGEGTPINKPIMRKYVKNYIPQGSSNLPTDSDRVKAPVVSAGSMDFGGNQAYNKNNEKDKKIGEGDLVDQVVKVQPEKSSKNQKRDSTIRQAKELTLREKCLAAEATIDRKLKEILATLKVMALAADRQKNVNIDIKSGVPKVKEAIEVIQQEMETTRKEQASILSLAEKQAQRSLITPIRASSKRAASSPAENQCATPTDKRIKDLASPPTWTEVTNRKKKIERPTQLSHAEWQAVKQQKRKEKTGKLRSEALLIKPLQGKTFAQVLGDIRGSITPEDTDTVVTSIRQTKTGCVLLELGRDTKDSSKFTEALKNVLGENGLVQNMVPKTSLEIRDLDAHTTGEEIEAALKRDLKELAEQPKIYVSKPNSRGQSFAVVELSEKVANELLKIERIKIGWVNCRVRRRIQVERCFKCLGYGHRSRNCKGPDRTAACFKCGKTGHKGANCNSEVQCVLCKELKLSTDQLRHIPGSGKCQVFRYALARARDIRMKC